MNNGPTYRGVLPRTDEHQERVLNACSLWSATEQVGMLRVAQFDSNGNQTGGFNLPLFDYVSLTQNSTQDIYVFKSGGSGGTTVATITLTFTSAAKTTLSTVAKT